MDIFGFSDESCEGVWACVETLSVSVNLALTLLYKTGSGYAFTVCLLIMYNVG